MHQKPFTYKYNCELICSFIVLVCLQLLLFWKLSYHLHVIPSSLLVGNIYLRNWTQLKNGASTNWFALNTQLQKKLLNFKLILTSVQEVRSVRTIIVFTRGGRGQLHRSYTKLIIKPKSESFTIVKTTLLCYL